MASAQSWTLIGLVAAFVDLCLAYSLLWGSVLWWFYSKFFNVLGLSLPCPCTGLLGYVNMSLCVHKLFVEIPIRKIYSVQGLIRSKYPFSSIRSEEHEEGSFSVKFSGGRNSANGFLELNGEVIPVKGKAAINQKQRSFRRRRRVSLGNGKLSPVLPLKGLESSIVDGTRPCVHDYNGVRSEINETACGTKYGIPDEEKFPTDADLYDKKWNGFELNESFDGSKRGSIGSDFVENIINSAHDNQELVNNDVNEIWMLKRTLEEVKAAHTALCLELEKERAAAATAADEAIAMILRLQEEKASIEMEVRQNQRMVEEKFAYDEDEMNLLKEILVRKEKENLFLENEVEAYKQMVSSGDKNLIDLLQEDADIQSGRSSSWLRQDDNLRVMIIEDGGLIGKNETRKSQILSNCELAGEERGDKEGSEGQSSAHETQQQVIYDVHVVEDTTDQKLERNGKGVTAEIISPLDELINFEQDSNASTSGELHPLGKMQRRSSVPDFGKSSLSDISSEGSKLDSEVGWLREMLRILQQEKEKLKLSTENKDLGKTQIKLLEEIRDQLQEIQYLREPPRHASLPPSFPKTNLTEGRRSQSGIWENP